MTIPIYQADAFTSNLFGGNPAAICPLKEWLPVPVMQKIAFENNLPETAFFVPQGDDYELRWFTPEMEIDLCGHATLATAHIMYTELGFTADHIKFHTQKAGTLIVHQSGERYTLDFPARSPETCDIPEGLVAAIGGEPAQVLRSRDYFLVYKTESEIRQLKPDFAALKNIPSVGFIVTAPGDDSDFVSRFFAPGSGIDEDPVTGSAHCSLVPYWAEQLDKQNLHAFQVSPRLGELFCQLKGDRVLMSGNVVTYLKGEVFLST